MKNTGICVFKGFLSFESKELTGSSLFGTFLVALRSPAMIESVNAKNAVSHCGIHRLTGSTGFSFCCRSNL